MIGVFASAIIFCGPADEPDAAPSDTGLERKPLRVVIHPRARQKDPKTSLITFETLRQLNNKGLDSAGRKILDGRFFSGYEDAESLKKFGYSPTSEIGRTLQYKRQNTDDPDNILHLNEYKNKQLFSDATIMSLKPLQEIQQGCQSKLPDDCSFKRYGQFWLKASLRTIDISRARSDNALVDLVKSLD